MPGHEDEPSPQEQTAPAPDDVKARFKAALDKKNATAHASMTGAERTDGVHGSETRGPVRRTFRRKAG